MEVCSINNVAIYNLGAGKSLPDWLSDRKKRSLVRGDSKIRNRIELIQGFEMPTVTTHIQVTEDQQFVLACGVYKPRLRCFEVSELSMKFERCLDYEIVAMETLAEDYSKLVLLSADRYVEFHARYGRYFRLRIPRSGRDLKYCKYTAELFLAGDSAEVYRLNLEQGQFFKAYETQAQSVNSVIIQEDHSLTLFGTSDGTVEAWDPRCRKRIGELAVGVEVMSEDIKFCPAITKMSFRDSLSVGIGTSSGHVLLYDIRSNKPYLIKDHMFSLPICGIDFHNDRRIISADCKALKIYDESGKIFTSVTTPHDINDFAIFGKSGLIFVATESPKILPYFIPSLGTAPSWCSFLDNITEELEETNQDTIYDDYRFVTHKELEELNLTNLIGTNLLRAYMHGFFIDVRLYYKAKELSQPFAYEEYRKKKIKERVEAMRADRVPDKSKLELPPVNPHVAQRLLEREQELELKNDKKRLKKFSNPMKDPRFGEMFANPDFEVDEQSEDFNRLRSVISTLQHSKATSATKAAAVHRFSLDDNEEQVSLQSSEESESSDEDEIVKGNQNNRITSFQPAPSQTVQTKQIDTDGFSSKSGADNLRGFRPRNKNNSRGSKLSLEERLKTDNGIDSVTMSRGFVHGNRVMTFDTKKKNQHEEESKRHMEERRRARRSAKGLTLRKSGVF